jgi:UrcA family protein
MIRSLITATILALTITSAQAGSVIVRFDDLNTADPADAKVLASRVHDAAVTACEPWHVTGGAGRGFYNKWFERCIARSSRDTTSRILAMSGQSRALARK